MRCDDAIKHLDPLRTAELDPRRIGEVADHLSVCADCRRALAQMERVAADALTSRPAAPGSVRTKVLREAGDLYGALDTELGRFWVAYSSRGIRMLLFNIGGGTEFEEAYCRRLHRRAHPAEVPGRYATLVRTAASGKASGPMPVDLSGLSTFERSVLEALQGIPLGEVRTYGWLAREAGRPAAIRAVGNAMARNPIPVLLPCHRVVPAEGGTGNYAFGSDFKRALLSREGVAVHELEKLRQRRIRYIGSDTTRIYCFPTCRAARRICETHRVPFQAAADAVAAGFHPCRLCRP